MKKIVSLLLALALVCGLCAAASATSATYANTRSFTAAMDAAGISYTVVGVDEDGDEKVTIENRDDDGNEYTIRCFFNKDNEQVNIRVWNIIEFKASDLANVLYTVNDLNYTYKWVKLYVDESDDSVTCSMDLVVRASDNVGDITLEACVRIANILTEAYKQLGVYAK